MRTDISIVSCQSIYYGYGCGPTGCSSAWQRRTFCGVLRLVGRRQHQIPDEPLRVGSNLVQPVRSVRNLGVHLDSDLSLNTHITRTVSCCFCCSATNTQHQSLFVNPSCNCSSCHWSFHGWSMVVRRRPAGRPTCKSARQTSVCLECCGASDLQIQEIWLRDAAAARPSLVANNGTNHVSTGGGRVTAKASFGGDCGSDRPSHGGFYDQRLRFLRRCLLLSVTSSATLPVFRKHLKTVRFTCSFPS